MVIYEAKDIAHAYFEILSMDNRVQFCDFSKDFFTSLLTQEYLIDRSFRGVATGTCFEDHDGKVEKIMRFPGKVS